LRHGVRQVGDKLDICVHDCGRAECDADGTIRELWRRIWFMLRGNRFNKEMEEEIRFHLDSKTEQNVDGEMSEGEAGYAGRRLFGSNAWRSGRFVNSQVGLRVPRGAPMWRRRLWERRPCLWNKSLVVQLPPATLNSKKETSLLCS
jgi:hypothetical protein